MNKIIIIILPEGGSESGWGGEVGELFTNAWEEESTQAVAIDGWDAWWCNPTDQTEPDHIQVSSKPISLEAACTQIQIQIQIQINHFHFIYNNFINYHVNFPPPEEAEAFASLLIGFLAFTGDFKNPGSEKYKIIKIQIINV